MIFQERITRAFDRENNRRDAEGVRRLTKTDLWKEARASSGAATHWFDGSNGMDLVSCVRTAPLLRVNPFWLFDESQKIDDPWGPAVVSEPVASRWPFEKWIPYSTIERVQREDLGYLARAIKQALQELESNDHSKSRSA